MKLYLTPILIDFFSEQPPIKILKSFTYKYLKCKIKIHNIN